MEVLELYATSDKTNIVLDCYRDRKTESEGLYCWGDQMDRRPLISEQFSSSHMLSEVLIKGGEVQR